MAVPADDLALLVAAGIAEVDLEQEAVECASGRG